MKLKIIAERSTILRHIRSFFHTNGYLEVETPVLAPELIPESTIEVFETTFSSDFHGTNQLYLIPSPEVYMKKLIAGGSGNIFQITKSFRNSEQIGREHNPEFTMIEWYTMEADYMDSIAITEKLLLHLTEGREFEWYKHPVETMSINELFIEYISTDLLEYQTIQLLRKKAAELGLNSSKSDTWEDIFNRIFLTLIEPELPRDRPVILYDYPKQIRCLAKEKKGTPWRERWELYIDGIELANCYTEETDSRKVEETLRIEYLKKSAGSRVIPDFDPEYSTMFDKSYPECSGVAMGIDRLIMLLTGEPSIQGVILFPLSDMVGGS